MSISEIIESLSSQAGKAAIQEPVFKILNTGDFVQGQFVNLLISVSQDSEREEFPPLNLLRKILVAFINNFILRQAGSVISPDPQDTDTRNVIKNLQQTFLEEKHQHLFLMTISNKNRIQLKAQEKEMKKKKKEEQRHNQDQDEIHLEIEKSFDFEEEDEESRKKTFKKGVPDPQKLELSVEDFEKTKVGKYRVTFLGPLFGNRKDTVKNFQEFYHGKFQGFSLNKQREMAEEVDNGPPTFIWSESEDSYSEPYKASASKQKEPFYLQVVSERPSPEENPKPAGGMEEEDEENPLLLKKKTEVREEKKDNSLKRPSEFKLEKQHLQEGEDDDGLGLRIQIRNLSDQLEKTKLDFEQAQKRNDELELEIGELKAEKTADDKLIKELKQALQEGEGDKEFMKDLMELVEKKKLKDQKR